MTKDEINKELGDLIFRFKVLKKALADEGEQLSPAHQRAAEIAAAIAGYACIARRALAQRNVKKAGLPAG